MSKNYIWTFKTTALASGLNGAFSLEYHINRSKLKVAPEILVGSRIWLVVKSGSDSFLYAFLAPSVIELYQEGQYKDDFLLRCEPFASVRLLPRQESLDPWRLPFEGDEEIRECTVAELSTLFELISKNERMSFALPSRALIESVPPTAFSDLEHAVPEQLMSTLRIISFGDASRSRSLPESISALGGIALMILKETHPHLKEVDIINLLTALDPLAGAGGGRLKQPEDVLGSLTLLPPIVDTFLEELDLAKIAPRIFVAKTSDQSLNWFDKTNDAEREHERILKELAFALKSKGFKVFKTRSFDLFAEKGSTRLLWEIKSASGSNSVSQGEKGIVQLLRYSTALSDEILKNLRLLLLLQSSEQRAVHQYLSRMAKKVGIEFWIYNERGEGLGRICDVETSPFNL